ncbi:MAG: hypothetical protein KAR62_06420 [Sphingomonadales bacterium]|nr:hypothetical protein [Sphingomonadales bacterium]
MFQQNKFTSPDYKSSTVTGRRFSVLPRKSVLAVAVIYLLSVLILVLLTKLAFAHTVEPTTVVEHVHVATDISSRVVAVVLGLAAAFGFFFASKYQAYKLLR